MDEITTRPDQTIVEVGVRDKDDLEIITLLAQWRRSVVDIASLGIIAVDNIFKEYTQRGEFIRTNAIVERTETEINIKQHSVSMQAYVLSTSLIRVRAAKRATARVRILSVTSARAVKSTAIASSF
jgi:hypothetical protein